jgi:hypothetical protein
VPKSIRNQVLWIQKTITEDINALATSDTSVAQVFQFNQFDDFAVYQAAFDQFGIAEVVVNYTMNTILAGSTIEWPTLHTALDYDGADFVSAPSTASLVDNYQSASTFMLSPGKSQVRVVRPCVAPALYQTAFSAYGVERLWVNTANGAIQHYGIVGVVHNPASNNFNIVRTTIMAICLRNPI